MTDDPKRITNGKAWAQKCAVENLCQTCGLPRTSAVGYTRVRCAVCAVSHRDASRTRHRVKVGIPHDAPIRSAKRGPRGPREAPKQYGTLTLEDIHKATSVLPLKPPGK